MSWKNHLHKLNTRACILCIFFITFVVIKNEVCWTTVSKLHMGRENSRNWLAVYTSSSDSYETRGLDWMDLWDAECVNQSKRSSVVMCWVVSFRESMCGGGKKISWNPLNDSNAVRAVSAEAVWCKIKLWHAINIAINIIKPVLFYF